MYIQSMEPKLSDTMDLYVFQQRNECILWLSYTHTPYGQLWLQLYMTTGYHCLFYKINSIFLARKENDIYRNIETIQMHMNSYN